MTRKERMDERLGRYMDEAVAAGRFASRAAILKAAKISNGYMGELAQRCATNPNATIHQSTARKLGSVLGVSPDELTHVDESTEMNEDSDRQKAVAAARYLQLPEHAIRRILNEEYASGLGTMYWFRRIETESERGAPSPELIGKNG